MNLEDLGAGELENLQSLPQGILLTGDAKKSLPKASLLLAKKFSKIILEIEPQKSKKSVNYLISNEDIKDLAISLRIKANQPRIVIIHQIEKMTSSAQSSFLKILEEPGDNIFYILNSTHPEKIKNTIKSRVQEFRLRPPKAETIASLLQSEELTPTERAQLAFIAKHDLVLLQEIIQNPELKNQYLDRMKLAKQFITGARHHKILIAYRVDKNKTDALNLIDDSILILKSGKITANEARLMENLEKARHQINQSVSIKLALTNSVI